MNSTGSQQASRTVFATYELLEEILLYLPTEDLVFAQHVSKQWLAVTIRSKRLRQLLFLEPGPGETGLLLPPTSESYRRVTLHPALVHEFGTWQWGSTWEWKLNHTDVVSMLSWNSGQWEAMFITQPITKTLYLNHGAVAMRNSTGLRLGTMVRAIRKMLDDGSRIGVRENESKSDSNDEDDKCEQLALPDSLTSQMSREDLMTQGLLVQGHLKYMQRSTPVGVFA